MRMNNKKSEGLIMFIDFNKNDGKFYANYYMEEYDLVIKLYLNKFEDSDLNLKIEKFTLSDSTYLLAYD